MIWSPSIGTLNATLRGTGSYRWLSNAYADGTVIQFSVRAVTANGVECGNTVTSTATADASAPGVCDIEVTGIEDDE